MKRGKQPGEAEPLDAGCVFLLSAVSWEGGRVRFLDLLRFAGGALRGHGWRTALSVTGVAVGIAAVVALTALGEGARQYVVDQFALIETAESKLAQAKKSGALIDFRVLACGDSLRANNEPQERLRQR